MVGDVKEIDKPLSLSRRHSFGSSHNPAKQVKQETRDKALRKSALNLGHTPFLISESLNTINPLLSRLSQRSPPPPPVPFERKKVWINQGFCKTAYLPLPQANINTYFSLRAK